MTVVPPWPLAIVRGWKPVENRTTNIAGSWRGRVLILTSAGKWDQLGAQFIAEYVGPPVIRRSQCHPGHIIGAADLVDVHRQVCQDCDLPRTPDHDPSAPGPTKRHPFNPPGGGCCRPWGEIGTWHLVWANPIEFAAPIRATGHLGLRRVTNPTHIRAALAKAA